MGDAAAGANSTDTPCHEGSNVLELMTRDADKGTALDALRAEVGPASCVYIGDDVPDEDAFARLGDGDLAVKVGRRRHDRRHGASPTRTPFGRCSDELVDRNFRRLTTGTGRRSLRRAAPDPPAAFA